MGRRERSLPRPVQAPFPRRVKAPVEFVPTVLAWHAAERQRRATDERHAVIAREEGSASTAPALTRAFSLERGWRCTGLAITWATVWWRAREGDRERRRARSDPPGPGWHERRPR